MGGLQTVLTQSMAQPDASEYGLRVLQCLQTVYDCTD
jgi:hypothetical protein